MTQRLFPVCLIALASSVALAKLPPPDPAAKTKADEAAAKAAWQAKVDTYQLCKTQDKLAARFGNKGHAAKPGSATSAAVVKTAAAAPAASAAAPAASASAPASSAASSAPGASAAKPASSAAVASADKPTPVPPGGSAPPPCQDPGPFSYNQPQQTPLETSGAHSPAGTAVNPPSVRPESGTMVPGKK
ncbi:MAG: hypothetical protein ACXWC2_13875 [Ramlibacter sp.]